MNCRIPVGCYWLLLLFLLVAGEGVGSVRLWALAGTLDRPSLALPATADPELRARVMRVLAESAETYLGGRFIHAVTTLRYGGDVGALNRFLAGLAGCPGVRLRISLVRDLEADWVLQHNGWGNAFELNVQVHLGSTRIRLEELQIPGITGG